MAKRIDSNEAAYCLRTGLWNLSLIWLARNLFWNFEDVNCVICCLFALWWFKHFFLTKQLASQLCSSPKSLIKRGSQVDNIWDKCGTRIGSRQHEMSVPHEGQQGQRPNNFESGGEIFPSAPVNIDKYVTKPNELKCSQNVVIIYPECRKWNQDSIFFRAAWRYFRYTSLHPQHFCFCQTNRKTYSPCPWDMPL